MMRMVVPAALAFAMLTLGTVAVAQTPQTTVFVTVDANERLPYATGFALTGIREGDAGPTTVLFIQQSSGSPTEDLAACERMALLAMNRPGQYQLRVNVDVYTPQNGPSFTSLRTCGLVRRTP